MREETRRTLPLSRLPGLKTTGFFLITFLGLAWDLWSKHSVFESLGYPDQRSDWSRSFFGGWMKFSFYTDFNTGAIWGLGGGLAWLFATFSIIAVIGVLLWFFIWGARDSWWLTVALALILSGTLGNLYDRLGLHGCLDNGNVRYAVRDFLKVQFGTYNYPIFNFADVFLVTGAIMLVLQSILFERDTNATNQRQAEAPAETAGTEK